MPQRVYPSASCIRRNDATHAAICLIITHHHAGNTQPKISAEDRRLEKLAPAGTHRVLDTVPAETIRPGQIRRVYRSPTSGVHGVCSHHVRCRGCLSAHSEGGRKEKIVVDSRPRTALRDALLAVRRGVQLCLFCYYLPGRQATHRLGVLLFHLLDRTYRSVPHPGLHTRQLQPLPQERTGPDDQQNN